MSVFRNGNMNMQPSYGNCPEHITGETALGGEYGSGIVGPSVVEPPRWPIVSTAQCGHCGLTQIATPPSSFGENQSIAGVPPPLTMANEPAGRMSRCPAKGEHHRYQSNANSSSNRLSAAHFARPGQSINQSRWRTCGSDHDQQSRASVEADVAPMGLGFDVMDSRPRLSTRIAGRGSRDLFGERRP
jgi:hypothetical protein